MDTREQHIEQAARIFAHYFANAPIRGVTAKDEMLAEMRTAAGHIVDAATPAVTVNVDSVDPNATKLKPGERDDRD